MEVILYADDHIHDQERPECFLFELLRQEFPVLGVHDLELAKKAVKSIGSFGALILDWQYGPGTEKEETFDDVAEELGIKRAVDRGSAKDDVAMEFLEKNDFYSLIYVFSDLDIETTHGEVLKTKFGDRIRFKQKSEFTNKEDAQKRKDEIIQDIQNWKNSHKHLLVPIQWSGAINESLQKIFRELSSAHESWLKELYDSAEHDGVSPELFIIEILQLVLFESIIQNEDLLKLINEVGNLPKIEIPDEGLDNHKRSVSRLFARLFYSELGENTPIMTGDICQLSENDFGIIITPECDIRKVISQKLGLEFLIFSKDSFQTTMTKPPYKMMAKNIMDELTKTESTVTKEQLKEVLQILENGNGSRVFNQENPRFHFLPAFPLISDNFDKPVCTDFTCDNVKISFEDYEKIAVSYPRKYKLNAPFIQQLRQRYLSHIGRVGTPALPKYASEWNSQK